MGDQNKLLIRDRSGRMMIGRVVQAVVASQASEVVVVTGHQAHDVAAAARLASAGSERVRIARAADFASGLSASLRTGIQSLSQVDSALICLGDMPLVTSAILNALMSAYDPEKGRTIIVPTCGGHRGNPVLWDCRFFPALAGLSGDRGARSLLGMYAEEVAELECHDEAVLRDFDTLDALIDGWGNPLA